MNVLAVGDKPGRDARVEDQGRHALARPAAHPGHHAEHAVVGVERAALDARDLQRMAERQAFGPGLELAGGLRRRGAAFEFPDKSNGLDFRVRHARNIAVRGEQFHALRAQERGGIKISCQRLPVITPDYSLLCGGRGQTLPRVIARHLNSQARRLGGTGIPRGRLRDQDRFESPL